MLAGGGGGGAHNNNGEQNSFLGAFAARLPLIAAADAGWSTLLRAVKCLNGSRRNVYPVYLSRDVNIMDPFYI